MAFNNLQLEGSKKIKNTYGNLNLNNDEVEKHILGTDNKHAAEDVTMDSDKVSITATDVKAAIEQVDTRVETLVNNPDPDKDLELVDVRTSLYDGVFATAKGRIDQIETDSANLKADVDAVRINVVANGIDNTGATDISTDIATLIAANSDSVIYFPKGDYLGKLESLPSTVHLVGEQATLIGLTDETSIIDITGTQKETIIIDGFILDGTSLLSGSEIAFIQDDNPTNVTNYIEIKNCTFKNPPTGDNHAIQLTGVDYGKIHDNFCYGFGGDVINCNAGYFITDKNVIEGVSGSDGGVAYNNGGRGIISENIIKGCDLGVGCGPENTTGEKNPFIISNNTILNCRYGVNLGWFAFAGNYPPIGVVVEGNTIADCKDYGIRFDGETTTSEAMLGIYNNTIYGCGSINYDGVAGDGVGISINYARFTSVTNNTISDCLGSAISTNSKDVTIDGNTIEDVSQDNLYAAIRCRLFEQSSACNNKITTSGNDGISVETGNNCRVDNNMIKGCVNFAIEFANSITEFTSLGNNCSYSDRGFIIQGGGSSDNWIVKNNICLNNTTSNLSVGGYTLGATRIASDNIS